MKNVEKFLSKCDDKLLTYYKTETVHDHELLEMILSRTPYDKMRLYDKLRRAGISTEFATQTTAVVNRNTKESTKPLTEKEKKAAERQSILNNPNVTWAEIMSEHFKLPSKTTKGYSEANLEKQQLKHRYHLRMLNWLKENPLDAPDYLDEVDSYFPNSFKGTKIPITTLKEYEARYLTETPSPMRGNFESDQCTPTGVIKQLMMVKAIPRLFMYEPDTDYQDILGLHLAARRILHIQQFLAQEGEIEFFGRAPDNTLVNPFSYHLDYFRGLSLDPEEVERDLKLSGNDYLSHYSESTADLRAAYAAVHDWYQSPLS